MFTGFLVGGPCGRSLLSCAGFGVRFLWLGVIEGGVGDIQSAGDVCVSLVTMVSPFLPQLRDLNICVMTLVTLVSHLQLLWRGVT